MSGAGEHPVGYRPPPGAGRSRGSAHLSRARRSGRPGCGCLGRTLGLLLAVFVGALGLIATRGEVLEEVTLAVDSILRSLVPEPADAGTAAAPGRPDSGESDAGGGPLEAVPSGSVTLPSGQVVTGDVRILSFDEVRAEGGDARALSLAIEKYPDRLLQLLAEGVDPNLPIPHGQGECFTHPTEKAARQGTRETLEILLDNGADVDGQSSDGDTTLHAAAWHGDAAALRLLLARGADPNLLSIGMSGRTSRERAEAAGQVWEPPAGASVLERAASRGHVELVRLLLDHGGVELRHALQAGARSGSVEVIDLLLEHGADPTRIDAWGNGPLRGAAGDGHVAVVERLLRAGARPGEQALREAAQRGRDDVLRAMAAAGVRFDGPPTYWSPLYSAAHAGRTSTVALLLELGASTAPFEDLGRPIDAAREQGHAAVVALLEGR